MTEPRASGLPNVLVLSAFPVVVALAFAVLVILGVSGTSSGVFWQSFGSGSDPDLLAGTPRAIRSDEWLVQSGWILSQAAQGFPAVNQALPGGMDATVQNDLPSWDWSSLFRPHVWGFLLFPLEQGMAVRWWGPAAAALVATHAFVVTVLPRRPVTAAVLATALLFSPVLQWWFLPTTLWPVAWAFTTCTAVIWCLRGRRRSPRIAWAAASGYLMVTMAMSIYVPYMVPAAYVVLFVVAGAVVQALRSGADRRALVRRAVPVVLAVLAAVGVLVAWVLTRLPTVEAVLGTVYPGARLEPTGNLDFERGVRTASGPFQQALQAASPGVLGLNAPESAAPLLVGTALLVILAWIVVRDRRAGRRADMDVVAVLAVHVVFFAFLVVPGWDGLAHVLLLDRTTADRLRLGLDLLNVVAFVRLVARLDRDRLRAPFGVGLLGAAVLLLPTSVAWATFHFASKEMIEGTRWWIAVSALLCAAVVAVARRHVTPAAVCVLAASLLVGAGVNPLYRGVFDLRETQAGQDVARVVDEDPDGSWVGVGGYVTTALLLESGVEAYNGVQTYPPEEMWRQIDPDGSDEAVWNRLANVFWAPGQGEPVVTNPVRDQIQVTFDGCSEFAHEHVDYVLSDQRLDATCLVQLDSADEGREQLRVYEVR